MVDMDPSFKGKKIKEKLLLHMDGWSIQNVGLSISQFSTNTKVLLLKGAINWTINGVGA